MPDFGSCCEDLRKAMTVPETSTFRIEDNGVLYLSVGYKDLSKLTWFDQSVIFCPFCGREIQPLEALKKTPKPSKYIRAELLLPDFPSPNFGTCCEKLNRAMSFGETSMFRVEEDNHVLYLTIGYVHMHPKTGWFDQAVIHCPFCGEKLQDKAAIAKRN